MLNDFPLKCSTCAMLVWIDLEGLQSRPIADKSLIESMGFDCPNCRGWEHLYFINPTLRDKQLALKRIKPGTNKYGKALVKLRQRFENLQKQVAGELARGESRDVHMAKSG